MFCAFNPTEFWPFLHLFPSSIGSNIPLYSKQNSQLFTGLHLLAFIFFSPNKPLHISQWNNMRICRKGRVFLIYLLTKKTILLQNFFERWYKKKNKYERHDYFKQTSLWNSLGSPWSTRQNPFPKASNAHPTHICRGSSQVPPGLTEY